jgi:hypothetical protein
MTGAVRYFCTFFDARYLGKGLSLHASLAEHCPAFRLWALCMDQATEDALVRLNLPNLIPIGLEEFEKDDKALRSAKENRSLVEYYFTCTPSLPLFILNRTANEVDVITYLDADLYFFASPEPLFVEMADASIMIIEHRYSPQLDHMRVLGIYNVGWLSFRRDPRALRCLQWWRERCLEWCHDRFENDRFADQKYLDDWPTRFEQVKVLRHKGANLAPWNLANYSIQWRQGRVLVDGQPLIFYHFHALKAVASCLFDSNLGHYKTSLTSAVRRHVYVPYIQRLREVGQTLEPLSLNTSQKRLLRGRPADILPPLWKRLVGPLWKIGRMFFDSIQGLWARQFLWVTHKRVL